jgi:hypothetical protein
MFPGPHAEVFYNEAGEPEGWDNHAYDEPDYDPYDRDVEERGFWREDIVDTLCDSYEIVDDESEQFLRWYEPRRYRFADLQGAVYTWRERKEASG